MKKLIAITIVLVMACGVAYAQATDSENIATSVNITSEFSIDISAAVADFGNVAQGASAAAGVTIGVTCYANTGNSWTVNVAGGALLHTDAVTTIPSDPNLKLYGFKTAGDGSVSAPYTTAQALPSVAANIYASAADDTGQDTFNLEIPAMTVPADQKAGAYSTTVTLTMTE